MSAGADRKILVLNAGSSSLKFELFDAQGFRSLAEGIVERIGEDDARLRWRGGAPDGPVEAGALGDHGAALRAALDAMIQAGVLGGAEELEGVGHRVVHGGERFREPTRVDDGVVEGIREHARLAPLHNPANLLGIEMAKEALPGVPQVAVFDTAFHHTLPEHAWRYALPAWTYAEHGVRRYGFHGISHRYVSRVAARFLGRDPESVDLIVLHLGNGASAAAVRRGRSVDTSMGLTPLEGLVMGSRPGDVDPGIAGYLQDEAGLAFEDVDRMFNRDSGLIGLCGAMDMRDVARRAADGDAQARLARAVYAYRIRKYVGAYLAVLGGADAIVFTAGVGENDAALRRDALAGLEGLGIALDPRRNEAEGDGVRAIHAEGGRIALLVVPTDEEREIAEQVRACLEGGGAARS